MSIEALRAAEAEARAFLNIESERRARYGWNGLREGMERFADSQRAYQERWPAAVDAYAAAVRATVGGEVEALVEVVERHTQFPHGANHVLDFSNDEVRAALQPFLARRGR